MLVTGGTRLRSRRRGHLRRPRFGSCRRSHLDRTRFWSSRVTHITWTWFIVRRMGYMTRSRSPSPGVGLWRAAGRDAFMPPGALTVMVLLVKPPVITMTLPVFGPMGIGPMEILPINRMSLVPRMPPRPIPVWRSDDIGGRVSVIRSPSISRAEKVAQDAVQEPIAVVIDPGCIRPHPRCRVNIRGRRWIRIDLSLRRRRCGRDRASSQHYCQRQNKNYLFHAFLPANFLANAA